MNGFRPGRVFLDDRVRSALNDVDVRIFEHISNERLRKEEIARDLQIKPHDVEMHIYRMRPKLEKLGYTIESSGNVGYMVKKLENR